MPHLLALLLSSSLHAAEVSELLTQRKRLDRSLLGTTRYALFVKRLNMGQLTIQVEKAPRRHTATYVVTSTLEIDVGTRQLEIEETLHLDARFGTLERIFHERRLSAESEREQVESLSYDGAGLWTFVRNGESTTFEHQGDNYEGQPAQIVLVSTLSGHAPGTWTVPSLVWRRADTEPQLKTGELVVSPPETITWWNEQIEATPIEAPGWEDGLAYVAQGRTLIIRPADTPFFMQACTDAQCSENLPITNPEEAAIMKVLAVFFKVFFGEAPIDAIDEITDWNSVYLSQAEEGQPALSPAELKTFIALIKDEISKYSEGLGTPPIPADKLVEFLDIAIDGDIATVTLPDSDKEPFTVRKTPEGWKVASVP